MYVSVVAAPRIKETWRTKREKYGSSVNKESICAWRGSCKSMEHLPVVFSNRGLLDEASGAGLRKLIGTGSAIS